MVKKLRLRDPSRQVMFRLLFFFFVVWGDRERQEAFYPLLRKGESKPINHLVIYLPFGFDRVL